MIVVSNTSPLTNLAAIGQFDLFPQLYARLHIAEGVWNELNARGRRWPGRNPTERLRGFPSADGQLRDRDGLQSPVLEP